MSETKLKCFFRLSSKWTHSVFIRWCFFCRSFKSTPTFYEMARNKDFTDFAAVSDNIFVDTEFVPKLFVLKLKLPNFV